MTVGNTASVLHIANFSMRIGWVPWRTALTKVLSVRRCRASLSPTFDYDDREMGTNSPLAKRDSLCTPRCPASRTTVNDRITNRTSLLERVS